MNLKKSISLSYILFSSFTLSAQGILIEQTLANPDNEPAMVFPIPSERQVLWQETEFYAFFHYGMNTFTNKEWGGGGEDESIYAPKKLPNCLQWIQTVKSAGMKGGIAVVKHHDGFCLWPTASTTHSVLKSGGVGPQVDLPQLFSDACKQENMKYGFYISPWDRNSAYYGKPEYVKDVFLKQVNELAQYGNKQFEMWFDGANGGSGYYGGANESRSIDASTYYDMPNLADSVHKIQPNCVIWGGLEARWIGNESGWAGTTNWATENRPAKGQGEVGYEKGWCWLPGESDAKGTNKGWFWHAGEAPRSVNQLFKFYLETVGRNATLILNLPPNSDGVLSEANVATLKELGETIKSRLSTDLTESAKITVSSTRTAGANRTYDGANLIDKDKESYWATNDGEKSDITITLNWDELQTIHYVQLQEYIKRGQRIKDFKLETSSNGTFFVERAKNQTTTVGYKRIVPLNGSTDNYGNGYSVKAVRITITDSKAAPLLHTISIY